MLGGAREDLRGQNVKLGFIGVEGLGIELRDLQRRFPLFSRLRHQFILPAVQHLLSHMTNIGNIFDVQNLKASIFESTADPVGHRKRAQVANMDEAVHSGTARVHLDLAIFYRNNLFNPFSQGIIDLHCCRIQPFNTVSLSLFRVYI